MRHVQPVALLRRHLPRVELGVQQGATAVPATHKQTRGGQWCVGSGTRHRAVTTTASGHQGGAQWGCVASGCSAQPSVAQRGGRPAARQAARVRTTPASAPPLRPAHLSGSLCCLLKYTMHRAPATGTSGTVKNSQPSRPLATTAGGRAGQGGAGRRWAGSGTKRSWALNPPCCCNCWKQPLPALPLCQAHQQRCLFHQPSHLCWSMLPPEAPAHKPPSARPTPRVVLRHLLVGSCTLGSPAGRCSSCAHGRPGPCTPRWRHACGRGGGTVRRGCDAARGGRGRSATAGLLACSAGAGPIVVPQLVRLSAVGAARSYGAGPAGASATGGGALAAAAGAARPAGHGSERRCRSCSAEHCACRPIGGEWRELRPSHRPGEGHRPLGWWVARPFSLLSRHQPALDMMATQPLIGCGAVRDGPGPVEGTGQLILYSPPSGSQKAG